MHENVPQFGCRDLEASLGTHYVMERIELSPEMSGWPPHRSRQIVVLMSRPMLQTFYAGLGLLCSPAVLGVHLALGPSVCCDV